MGILNATPNSFYSKFPSFEEAIEQGKKLIADGANILDIGGEPSWPGALPISEAEELARVIPLIKELHSLIPISVDTTKADVAVAAIEAGATLINDITGFQNPAMLEVAASYDVDLCVMHMQGTPQTMQVNPSYPEGVVPTLLGWFEERVGVLLQKGVKKSRIILDPGIGFGKTVAHNLEILQNLPQFRALGFPLLIGISRKSFMGKILGKKAPDLLPATLAINAHLIMSQVDFIRVHDVKEHKDAVDVLKQLQVFGVKDGGICSNMVGSCS